MTSDAPHPHPPHDERAAHQFPAVPAGPYGASSTPQRRVSLTIRTGPLNGAAREKSVEEALKPVPGVTRVHMHPRDGYAHVTVREGTPEHALRAAALAAGVSEAG